jgi:hypothetical protein
MNLDLLGMYRTIMTSISKHDQNVIIISFNFPCTIAINAMPKFTIISPSSVKSVHKSNMTYNWLISFSQCLSHFLFTKSVEI